MSSRKRSRASSQMNLFGASSPKREARMGSVEAERWGEHVGGPGPWEPGADGWRGAAGVAPLLVGVDEAGRGPLAGPVSVSALVLDPGQLKGEAAPEWVRVVDDSKKLTEAKRRRLFGGIVRTARSWAIVHVHSDQVDEVNILQATFQGMSIAVEQALGLEERAWAGRPELRIARVGRDGGEVAEEERCWYAGRLREERALRGADALVYRPEEAEPVGTVLVLVDGNARFVVQGAATESLTQEPIVKGDALSVNIAAASVLAKVSRDRAMAICDELWPVYGLAGHKGYPTAKHKAAIAEHGPCPVHRRSFRW